jgi:hypothetical protein
MHDARHCLKLQARSLLMRTANKAPAPNRRPCFPLGTSAVFVYRFSAPPVTPAAVGEARRWVMDRA